MAEGNAFHAQKRVTEGKFRFLWIYSDRRL